MDVGGFRLGIEASIWFFMQNRNSVCTWCSVYIYTTIQGEAEAELAYLNRHIAVIDGILSGDVDNFRFGATIVCGPIYSCGIYSLWFYL